MGRLLRSRFLVAGLAIVVCSALLTAWRFQEPLPQGTAAEGFSALRARQVLSRVLPTDAPHPLGSREQEAVRSRILRELYSLDLVPEVQTATACSAQGICGEVRNILVHLPGATEATVLVSAHTDSTAAGPGAADDGSGVAILVELARLLRHGEAHNGIILLFTEGEELGMLGAIAFLEQHPLAARVDVAVNLEARGQSGVSMLFQTQGPDAWLMETYAAHAPAPFSTSLAKTVYETMPHGTDLSAFAAFGIPGVDFAFFDGAAAYHSPLDTLERLDWGSVQSQGDNALAMVRGLVDMDLDQPRTGHAVWFDVFGLTLVVLPRTAIFPISAGVLALWLGLLLWRRRRGAVGGRTTQTLALCMSGTAVLVSVFVPSGAYLLVFPPLGAAIGALLARLWGGHEEGWSGLGGLVISSVLWFPVIEAMRIALGSGPVLWLSAALALVWMIPLAGIPLWRAEPKGGMLGSVVAMLLAFLSSGCSEAPAMATQRTGEGPFWWGVATSPYQVEDPGESTYTTDWDLSYARGDLKHARGQGAWSWTQMARDRAALKDLGVSHYRFGIEWARVEPEPGVYDTAALQRYADHARALAAMGIEPVVCLWHFTFPDWATNLDDPHQTGWLHPQTTARWSAYVAHVAAALGPDVTLWAPQNEPNAQAMAAYFMGIWPPGVSGDLGLVGAHTQAAADRFVEAASILRASIPGAQIITIQNIIAFEREGWDVPGLFVRVGERYNHDHLDRVHESADLIGFNYYYRRAATPYPAAEESWPAGIRWAIEDLQTRYGKPLVVMENGLGTDNEALRQAYLRAHTHRVLSAREDGWDVRGYFLWSLVDNYEWAQGWDVRYGLYGVDPTDQSLVPKDSVALYRRIVRGQERP
jgi:beta-glucosidase